VQGVRNALRERLVLKAFALQMAEAEMRRAHAEADQRHNAVCDSDTFHGKYTAGIQRDIAELVADLKRARLFQGQLADTLPSLQLVMRQLDERLAAFRATCMSNSEEYDKLAITTDHHAAWAIEILAKFSGEAADWNQALRKVVFRASKSMSALSLSDTVAEISAEMAADVLQRGEVSLVEKPVHVVEEFVATLKADLSSSGRIDGSTFSTTSTMCENEQESNGLSNICQVRLSCISSLATAAVALRAGDAILSPSGGRTVTGSPTRAWNYDSTRADQGARRNGRLASHMAFGTRLAGMSPTADRSAFPPVLSSASTPLRSVESVLSVSVTPRQSALNSVTVGSTFAPEGVVVKLVPGVSSKVAEARTACAAPSRGSVVEAQARSTHDDRKLVPGQFSSRTGNASVDEETNETLGSIASFDAALATRDGLLRTPVAAPVVAPNTSQRGGGDVVEGLLAEELGPIARVAGDRSGPVMAHRTPSNDSAYDFFADVLTAAQETLDPKHASPSDERVATSSTTCSHVPKAGAVGAAVDARVGRATGQALKSVGMTIAGTPKATTVNVSPQSGGADEATKSGDAKQLWHKSVMLSGLCDVSPAEGFGGASLAVESCLLPSLSHDSADIEIAQVSQVRKLWAEDLADESSAACGKANDENDVAIMDPAPEERNITGHAHEVDLPIKASGPSCAGRIAHSSEGAAVASHSHLEQNRAGWSVPSGIVPRASLPASRARTKSTVRLATPQRETRDHGLPKMQASATSPNLQGWRVEAPVLKSSAKPRDALAPRNQDTFRFWLDDPANDAPVNVAAPLSVARAPVLKSSAKPRDASTSVVAPRNQDTFRFWLDDPANDAPVNVAAPLSVARVLPSKRVSVSRSQNQTHNRETRAQNARLPSLLMKNPLELGRADLAPVRPFSGPRLTHVLHEAAKRETSPLRQATPASAVKPKRGASKSGQMMPLRF
jgi:hypothetical protein